MEMSTEDSVLPESLRIVIIGGEEARADSAQRWVKIAARSDNPPRLVNGYGPTETTVIVTSYELMISAANTQEIQVLPIGRPTANTMAYILDPQMQPVPIGVPGELHIGGVQVARGYLNRPDLTSEKFIKNPFSNDPDARLYKTGDLVRYLPDGNIEYLGRNDTQVKVRGYRIELQEIESVLQRHSAIREAIVLAREDSSGNKQLIAYVVTNVGRSASSVELREALRSQLPEFMVPSEFVPLDTFPLTFTGKVDRRALPAPGTSSPDLMPQYEPPAGAIECQLAEIWCSLLAKERVGRRDDIFDLGGHSLTLTQLAARIQDNFDVRVPLTLLFDHRTIEQMALVILEQLLE
jgi:acyl-CoA synthetase (AMP-forming)/AMP-acid ligase II/acyl carrier protein